MAESIDRRCIAVALWQWRCDLGGEVYRDEFGSTTRFDGAALGRDLELDSDSQAAELAGAAWRADWTGRRNVARERWIVGAEWKLVVELSRRWCGDTCGICLGG